VLLGLGGCIGLILLLLVVAGGCAAILASIGGDTDSKSGDSKLGAPKEEQATVPVGEPVTVGDVQWTVTDARQTNRLESSLGQFGDPKQGNFVVVDFNFTNNGSEPVTLDSASLALLDGEGRESQADPGMFEYISKDRNIFLEQVNPGVTRQGRPILRWHQTSAGSCCGSETPSCSRTRTAS
jgi:uncharacterized protein DUF4352